MVQAVETTLGGLVSGALFAVIALGFSLVFRITGVLNLSQGAFVIFGILTAYSAEQWLQWPLPAAVVGTVAAAVVLGALVERLIIRRARRIHSTSGVLILTAGLLLVFEGAAILIWGTQPYSLPPFSGRAPIPLPGGIGITPQAVWVIGLTVVLLATTWFLLTRSSFGRALRACAENPVGASVVGVDVNRMSLFAFSAGAGIGALGGIVSGPLLAVSFDSGNYFSTQGFVAVALGGMASLLGSVAGGLALGLAQQLAAGYVSSLFSTTFAFGLLLVVLVFRPSGLLSRAPAREDTGGAASVVGYRLRIGPRSGWLLAAAAAVVLLILPAWLEPNGLTATFVIAGTLFIAVLGLDLLMGFAGQVSLGQAGFMAIGAYAVGIMTVKQHANPLVGIAVGLVFSLLVALILAVITGRLRGLYLALATLGFGLLIDSLTIGLVSFTGGPSGLPGIPSLQVGTYIFATPVSNYYLVWVIAGVLLLLSANLMRSGYGRALQAIRADPAAAEALGINVALYKASVLLISAVFASIAGSLYALNFHYLAPDLVNTSESLELVTMLMVGGPATLAGPLLGALLITVLPTSAQSLAQAKTLVEGCILVLILLFLPGGLVGGLAGIGGWASRLFRPSPTVARVPSDG